MAKRRQRGRSTAVGAGVLAAAVLLAGCSNHSGLRRLRPTDVPSPVAATTPSASPAASTSAAASAARRARPSRHASPSASAAPGSTSAPAVQVVGHRRSTSPHPRPTRSTSRPQPSSPAPAPGAAVAADPTTGLRDGERVQVSGTHLAAGEAVDVRECLRSDLATCAGFSGTPATAGSSGAFRADFYVSATVWLTGCGHSGCVIRVRRAGGAVLLVPISFG